MWFDKKAKVETSATVEDHPAVAAAPVQEPVAPEKKSVVVPPYGFQAHGLTRFGNSWLNLDEVSVIEFDPPDGCGAECLFKGGGDEWHIPDADAAAIREYLNGLEAAGRTVDSAGR
jgi:hypothetical protein